MSSIIKSSAFDASSVQFSKLFKNTNGGKAVYLSAKDGSKIHIQLPWMRTPFGFSMFEDKSSGKMTYSLDIAFEGADPEVELLKQKLEQLDEIVVNAVAKNVKEWLDKDPKDYDLAGIKKYLFKKTVKLSKEEKYSPTLKLKIAKNNKTDTFVPEAYNLKREQVPLTDIEKNQTVMCIVELNQIHFINDKFGVTIKLLQVLLQPSKNLPKFAFDLPDTEMATEEGEEEEEEVDDQQETGDEEEEEVDE